MTTTEKKIDELYKLIDGIGIAMLTTRRTDGALVSRPMANQARSSGADLYFATEIDSPKMRDITNDPHVNVSYFRNSNGEWVSVAGIARISRDRAKIKELYRPDWRAWFEDEGGKEDGGPDDPRIALIAIETESVEYLVVNKPRPVILFEVAVGMVTGKQPNLGEERHISGGEMSDR